MKYETSLEEAELIGALLGDGHIYRRNRKYIVGFTGNPITDRDYFEYLKKLISTVWHKEAKIKFRERAVRIQLNSKSLVYRLIEEFKIPFYKGKCAKVKIPKQIAKDWKLAKCAIRGVMDTDGSVFMADKPGSPNYPSIELTTTSKDLSEQVRNLLRNQGFKVANIWAYCSKTSVLPAYKVPLNGRQNLEKWIREIGFSNPHKKSIALKALGE